MNDNRAKCVQNLLDKHGREVLSKREAANELKISESTLDRMRQNGVIKSLFIGGAVRIHICEIARMVIQ